jgi:hypothetical protein
MSLPLLKTTSRDEAIGLLAPALGEEKARATIDEAARALGLTRAEWSTAQFRGVFAHVSMEAGLVGITARVVARRLKLIADGHTTTGSHQAPLPPRAGEVGPPAHTPGPRAVETSKKPIEALSDLLAQALGAETAKREVERAARTLGYGETIHFSAALKLLEHMTHEPGLVGIAAQFAKTRLHLITW